jgi:hypothetical protein
MTDQPSNHFQVTVGGDVGGQLVAGHGNVVVGGGGIPVGAVARGSPRRPLGHDQPVHYSIVAIDVASSGARDDQLQLRMRADLRAIVAATLARQPQDMSAVDRNDLGDGVRLVVPATITPRSMLDPFVPNLASALHEHRKAATDNARLRLRVAVHMGLLHRDDDGWAGHPLVHCARLLDASAVRRVLDVAQQADLVLVVSAAIYEAVVQHGYGLDPAGYRQIVVSEKETRAPAWIHVPGYPVPPQIDGPDTPH